jgi:hypothetical protein
MTDSDVEEKQRLKAHARKIRLRFLRAHENWSIPNARHAEVRDDTARLKYKY